jgi:hypothetical protein
VIFRNDQQGAMNQIATILGEAFQEKYWTDKNKLVMANSVRYLAQNAQAQFMSACQQSTITDEHRAHLDQAFNFH